VKELKIHFLPTMMGSQSAVGRHVDCSISSKQHIHSSGPQIITSHYPVSESLKN